MPTHLCATGMGEPIQFIHHVDGGFHVTKEAKSMLKKIKGKMALVCVAGCLHACIARTTEHTCMHTNERTHHMIPRCRPYRTGKSFLLNRLVGKSQGFKGGRAHAICVALLFASRLTPPCPSCL